MNLTFLNVVLWKFARLVAKHTCAVIGVKNSGRSAQENDYREKEIQ